MRIVARPYLNEIYAELCAKQISPLLAQVIASRPIPMHEKGALGVYDPRLADLDNPLLLKDMDIAIGRLLTALEQGEVIGIETDHDCDGQTSHAVLYSALTEVFQVPRSRIRSYIGHRLQEGYGLSALLAQRILADEPRPSLIITADNGSSDEPRIALLKAEGIDVIVTDHHHLPPEGPPKSAYACLNPTRTDCQFPDPYIAGCMVSWLLMAGLRHTLIKEGKLPQETPSLACLLDYVAVGTVADCVSLARSINNRAVVRRGLQLIRQAKRPCWQALLPLLNGREVTAEDLGFLIGPMLNSDGRLGDAFQSINFLLSQDPKEALPWARALFQSNQERKQIQKTITEQAETIAKEQIAQGAWSLVIYLPEGHAGVHGISASRLKDRFGRPTIIFSPKNAQLITGSARSIEPLHLRDALQQVADQCPGLLASFGGHAGAAGLTLEKKHLVPFQAAFEKVVRERLTESSLGPVLYHDGELAAEAITLETVNLLQSLAPFGREFDAPLFAVSGELVSYQWIGSEQNHLRLYLGLSNGTLVPAVWFGADQYEVATTLQTKQKIVAYAQLSENVYQNQAQLQLMVSFIKTL